MSNLDNNNSNGQTEKISFYTWIIGWLPRQRGLFVLFFLLLISIPLALTVFLVVLPVINAPLLPTEAELNEADTNDRHLASTWDKASLRMIAAKELEQLMMKNRLALASRDSIYLILDLNDSTVTVEIKGLPVHKVRAEAMYVSNRIRKASHSALLRWLDQPFSLQQELATIARTPILIIDAPKDTSEAARLPRKPLEPEKDFVQYSLLFDRQLLLEIRQSEPPLPEDADSLANYRYRYDTTFNRPLLQRFINPFPADGLIKIKLSVPQEDARTIYRAMPHSVYARLIVIPPLEK
ncbi:MAG: hypothetical protein IPM52_08145 [Bacteroidetes bacterium]|nr:hypothetical protein [Bacteroidota bacterium]